MQRWNVKCYPSHIKTIRNPLPEIQLLAVKRNYWMIQHIKNPTKTVQLYVANKNREAARYVNNPCDELKVLIDFWEL